MDRVIVRLSGGTIRGYADKLQFSCAARLQDEGATQIASAVILREGSASVETVPLTDVKAVFFVKTFEGQPAHQDIHFHNNDPIPNSIWASIKFRDGEVLEGMIANSIDYLCGPGFYFRPTDPASNNKLVYVLRNQIVDFKVLGLREEARSESAIERT